MFAKLAVGGAAPLKGVTLALLFAVTYTQVYTSPTVVGHQGYATDGTVHFLFDTTAIRVYDASWRLVSQNLTALPNAPVNHFGDGDYHKGRLYLPVEQWTSCGEYRNTGFAVFDAKTLRLQRHVMVQDRHEVAGVAVVPPGDPYLLGGVHGVLYAVSFCGDDKIHAYDLQTFDYLGFHQMDRSLWWMQGIAYREGAFYISDINGNVFKVEPMAFGPAPVLWLFTDDHPGAGEGIDYSQGELRFHRDQGPHAYANVYYYAPVPGRDLDLVDLPGGGPADLGYYPPVDYSAIPDP